MLIDRLVVLAWLVTTSAGEQRLIVPLLPNLKYSQPEIRHDLRALPGARLRRGLYRGVVGVRSGAEVWEEDRQHGQVACGCRPHEILENGGEHLAARRVGRLRSVWKAEDRGAASGRIVLSHELWRERAAQAASRDGGGAAAAAGWRRSQRQAHQPMSMR